MLSSENIVENIFSHNDYFISKGFQPNLTIQLRTARTVFCYGFDDSLLRACDSETIKQSLIDASPSWEVSSVYILQSKRSMKIEFKSRTIANNFLEMQSINISGIRIESHNMEPEVDPSIDQCYNCGILDPGHTREQCPYPPSCLRCGYEGHLFFQCQLIPNIPPSQYSEYHKNQAYCIPCRNANGHCSLNHRACPVKRNMIKNRILENRSNRAKVNAEKNKGSELGKQIADELSKIKEWPCLPAQANILESSITMSAIITLAMIEEAHCQGSFQTSLDKACTVNNFPKFKYDLDHDAAIMVVRNLSANPGAVVSLPKSKSRGQSKSQPVKKDSPMHLMARRTLSLRSVTDTRKHLNNTYTDVESDSYASDISGRTKRPRYSPSKSFSHGDLSDIRSRLEEQTYVINTKNDKDIGTGIEEIPVKDLLTLYEMSNSEFSLTKRQIIEALLAKAVDIDRDMTINANIIRVREDFH